MTLRCRTASLCVVSLLGCGDVASDLITHEGGGGTGGAVQVSPTGGAATTTETTGGRASEDGPGENGGEHSDPGPGPGSGGNDSNEGPEGDDSGPDSVCQTSDDCRGDRHLCHPETHRCVECVEDGHCSDEHETCSADLGICAVACHGPADCPEDDGICDLDLDGGICVECRIDADCGPEKLCRSSECED